VNAREREREREERKFPPPQTIHFVNAAFASLSASCFFCFYYYYFFLNRYVPVSFLFGFIAMAGVRSTGDLYLLDYKAYKPLIKFAGSDVSSVLRFFRNF